MKNHALALFLILNSLFYTGFAQLSNLDKTNPASPKSAELISEVKIPVNIYRGLPTIEIPLYTISEDYGLDLKLEYNSSGLKLNNLCEWVGLNWNLATGGIITRIKRGKTIDEHYAGYINSGAYLNDAVWNNVTENPATATSDNYLYFDRANSDWDSEPDVFYFSFGKYNGQFMFKHNGTTISSSPALKIEPQFRYFGQYDNNAEIIGWKITVEDGTIFEFMKYELFEGSMSSIDKQCHIAEGSAFPHYPSAWYLTKINIADNKVIDFYYNPTQFEQLSEDCDEYFTIHPTYNSAKNQIKNFFQNKHYQSYIDSIKTDLKTIVFECDELLDESTKKLSRIKIYNSLNHNLIQTITFNYEDFACLECGTYGYGPNLRFLLKDVKRVSSEGNTELIRSFVYDPTPVSYINPISDGFYSIGGMDHWGYYNGVAANSYNSLIPIGSTYDSYFINSFNYVGIPSRTPNLSATKAGVLLEMKYPTGGSVVFDYELNDYSYVNNTITKSGKISAGGLRIKTITYKYGNQNPDVIKTYSYISKYNSSLSSGVIDNESNYEFSFNLNGILSYTTVYKGSKVTKPINIGYSRVTEEISGGGKTIYEYTTARDYPASQDQNLFCYYDIPSSYSTTGFITTSHPFLSVDNNEFKRGLLTNKYQIDNIGAVIERDSMNYAFITYSGDNGFSLFWNEYCTGLKFCFLNLVPCKIGVALKNEEINYKYGNTQAFFKNRYVYNSQNLVTQIISNQSNGTSKTTNFKYPNDFATTQPYSTMIVKHILSPVVEKTVYVGANLIQTEKYNFSDWGNNIFKPVTIQNKLGSTGTTQTLLTFNSYDSQGNVRQVTGKDGIIKTYLWDATRTYVMAEIENKSYSQISSSLDSKPCTYSSKTLYTSLKSSAPYITTFTYDPLFGITQQTDPTGITTYYYYDGFGRLSTTKNDDSKLLNKYDYHFAN